MSKATDSEGPVALPTGDGVAFPLSRREPLFYIWIVLGAGGLVILLVAGNDLWHGNRPDLTILVLLSGAFGLIAGIFGFAYWRAASDRSGQAVVSAHGLVIPPLAREPIPWAAVRALRAQEQWHRGSRQSVTLVIDADDPESFGLRSWPVTRKLNSWWFGTPLTFNIEPLAGEPEDVIAAIRRYAPPELLASGNLRLAGSPMADRENASH